MPTQLMKLRQVPEDELLELYALLDAHEIDYYETSNGSWGISMPALWLVNDEQLVQANALLNEYSKQRSTRVRAEYDALKKAGKPRSWWHIAREKPLRFIFYIIAVGVLFGLSVGPFINMMRQ